MSRVSIFFRVGLWLLALFVLPEGAAAEETKSTFMNAAGSEQAHYLFDVISLRQLIGLLLVAMFASFGALLLFSKLFAGAEGTFFNGLKFGLFFYALLAGVQFVASIFLLVFETPWLALIFLVLAIFIGPFYITMKAYQINFWRAFGLVLCILISTVGLHVGSLFLLPIPLRKFAFQDRRAFDEGFNRWQRAQAVAKGLPVDLAIMHAELETKRSQLDVNDPAAVMKFNQELAEYNAEQDRQSGKKPPTKK